MRSAPAAFQARSVAATSVGVPAAAEARSADPAASATPAPPPRPPCALVTTPFFHVSGLYTGGVMMLAVGAKIVMRAGRFDPVDAMRLIEGEQVTSWGPMGTMAYRVVHHPERARFDLSSITQIGSGGAPMHPDLQARIREAFPSARRSLGLVARALGPARHEREPGDGGAPGHGRHRDDRGL